MFRTQNKNWERQSNACSTLVLPRQSNIDLAWSAYGKLCEHIVFPVFQYCTIVYIVLQWNINNFNFFTTQRKEYKVSLKSALFSTDFYHSFYFIFPLFNICQCLLQTWLPFVVGAYIARGTLVILVGANTVTSQTKEWLTYDEKKIISHTTC